MSIKRRVLRGLIGFKKGFNKSKPLFSRIRSGLSKFGRRTGRRFSNFKNKFRKKPVSTRLDKFKGFIRKKKKTFKRKSRKFLKNNPNFSRRAKIGAAGLGGVGATGAAFQFGRNVVGRRKSRSRR